MFSLPSNLRNVISHQSSLSIRSSCWQHHTLAYIFRIKYITTVTTHFCFHQFVMSINFQTLRRLLLIITSTLSLEKNSTLFAFLLFHHPSLRRSLFHPMLQTHLFHKSFLLWTAGDLVTTKLPSRTPNLFFRFVILNFSSVLAFCCYFCYGKPPVSY